MHLPFPSLFSWDSSTFHPCINKPLFEPTAGSFMASGGDIFAAFGAVLGYIGAEAATISSFERLLWPQRFLSNMSPTAAVKIALLMPMGGPLHKPGLKTLDKLLTHGLFKGSHQGDMLGTAFFRQLSWSYTMYAGDAFDGINSEYKTHTEPLRNCLWARVLSYMPIPTFAPPPGAVENTITRDNRSSEAGTAEKAAQPRPPPLRAQIMVSHLTISKPTREDLSSLPYVRENVTGRPGPLVLLAICTSEASAILTTLGVFVIYHSAWGLLFLAPLLLRLLSALLTLEREPLVSLSSETANDPPCDFEIHCPESGDGSTGFMLITGPPALVLQFFRHYGHPLRNRFCEVMQIAILVTFTSLFPISLLCSVVWMCPQVQSVWLCYQLYVMLAMHVARYTEVGRATSTEKRIAELLSSSGQHKSQQPNSDAGAAILFGQRRRDDAAGVIKVSAVNTFHGRHKEGRACMDGLLSRRRPV